MAVYLVLVTDHRLRSIPDYPLFLFAAILPWKWFTVGDHRLGQLGRLADPPRETDRSSPRSCCPVASTMAGVVGLHLRADPAARLMLLFYPDRLSSYPIFIPVIAGVQFVFTLAVGIIVAAGTSSVRDLGNVIGHLLRLWWYLSPGLYSIALLSDHQAFEDYPILHTILVSNPFAILLEAYRSVIYGTPRPLRACRTSPPWRSLLVASVDPARDHDRDLQAARAQLREGAVTRWPTIPARHRSRRPATPS